jgi:hypothetical protein
VSDRTVTRYWVYTWDVYRQEFTPQQGVRCGPYSLWGLRRALRKLRAIGYPACKGDPAVLVESAPVAVRRGKPLKVASG